MIDQHLVNLLIERADLVDTIKWAYNKKPGGVNQLRYTRMKMDVDDAIGDYLEENPRLDRTTHAKIAEEQRLVLHDQD